MSGSGTTTTTTKTPMPFLGDRGAPEKFTGNSSYVKRFLRHYNRLCTDHGVTADQDKCEMVLDYCSHKVNRVIENLKSYKDKNWSDLEHDLLSYYDADKLATYYTVPDLIEFCNEW